MPTKKKASRKAQVPKAKSLVPAESGAVQSALWKSFIRAAEAEPREAQTIRGATGIQHPVLAAGVDDKRQRLILVTEDANARSAALMQADIQSANDSVHVIVARPIIYSVAEATRSLLSSRDPESITDRLEEKVREYVDNQMLRMELLTAILSENGGTERFLNWSHLGLGIRERLLKGPEESESERLDRLLAMEPDEQDRRLGLCPIPLYQFDSNDLELMIRGSDVEAVKDVLLRAGVLQYFFPPPDQLALGFTERLPVKSPSHLVKQVEVAPELGHPFGPAEITGSKRSIAEMIDELQGRKLLVEGEIGYELTPEGESVRRTIRFKPREGLLSKLINRFSLNIDLKDLFKGGGTP